MIGFLGASIPRRTLAALLSIFLVTYAGTAVIVYSGVRASMLKSHADALNQLAELKYQQLAGNFTALATDITAWSQLDVMNDLLSGDIDQRVTQTLEGLKRLYALPGQLYAFDSDGKLIAASSDTPAEKVGARIPGSWVTNGTGLRLVARERDLFTGVSALVVETPVFGSFDRNYRSGTLALTVPWAAIAKQIANPDAQMSLLETGRTAIVLATAGARQQSQNGAVLGKSQVSGKGLTGNWQIVAAQDAAVATAPLRQVVLELVLLGVFLGFPIVLLGRLLSTRLTAPIAALTTVVCEIAATDRLKARVPVTSADELGSLAESFNTMIEKLAKTAGEREQFVQDLAALNETLEARIAERTEELKKAVESQKRLIGDISHEIKTPLARLSMALGLARRKEGRDSVRQLNRMETEIDNISALAGELLSLARLDRAAAPLNLAALDIGKLVEKIVTDARFERPSRSHDLILRKPGFPLTVMGNADFLRRAVENVVRNAMFYTAENTAVEVTVLERTAGKVCIEVSDHGLGVPESALPHLFEPFYRVDEARTRQTGGSGIGLSICDRVVRLHGGVVRARNRDPHGLVITIEIPLATGLPGSPQPARAQDLGVSTA